MNRWEVKLKHMRSSLSHMVIVGMQLVLRNLSSYTLLKEIIELLRQGCGQEIRLMLILLMKGKFLLLLNSLVQIWHIMSILPLTLQLRLISMSISNTKQCSFGRKRSYQLKYLSFRCLTKEELMEWSLLQFMVWSKSRMWLKRR